MLWVEMLGNHGSPGGQCWILLSGTDQQLPRAPVPPTHQRHTTGWRAALARGHPVMVDANKRIAKYINESLNAA